MFIDSINTLEIDAGQENTLKNKKQKKIKLLHLINQLFDDSVYKDHLSNLMKKLALNKSEVIDAYLGYNLDIELVANTAYASIANRLVLHIHNLMQGSWHQLKQQYVLEAIRSIPAKKIIDVGFGVPTQYVSDYILKKSSVFLTLCDFDASAADFAEILLSSWDADWQRKVNFKKSDMNDMEYLGDFDIYLFQDCIEHTYNPTEYLKKQVRNAPAESRFIFILAIGPLIPMHYICWKTFEIAIEWLNHCGLKIDAQKTINTNPQVDLFALEIPFKFGFFCCSK